MLNKALSNLYKAPKKLFLIDALGAALSSFLLGIVLVKLESIFGIPKNALYILATIPLFFIVYDVLCYVLIKNNFGPFLKGIALLNVGYCGLSLALVYGHADAVQSLGWIYIVVEILIVLFIAKVEWKYSKEIKV